MTELPARRGFTRPLQSNFEAIAAALRIGKGDPEGVIAAQVGTLYIDRDGGTSTVLYVKETGGATNTGWRAV